MLRGTKKSLSDPKYVLLTVQLKTPEKRMKTITRATFQTLCDLCDAVLWEPILPGSIDGVGPSVNGEGFKTITVTGRTFWIKPLYEVSAPVASRPSFFEWMVLTQDDPWQIRFTRSQNLWFAPAGLRRGLIGNNSEPEKVIDRFSVRFVGDRHVFERDMLAVKMFLVKDEDSPVAIAV